MSNKNINVWDLVKNKKIVNEKDRKRKIILNSTQKLKNFQYKTSNVNKRQSDFNFNKLQTINALKYLSPVNALKYLSPVNQTEINENIQDRFILTSIEYNNGFIDSLNPKLWIDSSDLISILRDKNNNVYQILDKSGNNNHLYQNVVINQPKYHNGSLLFNGNQFINGNYTFTQSINNMSMFIVMKQYEQANVDGIISGYSISSPNDYNDSNAWAFQGKDISSYQYQLITNQNTLRQTNNISKTMPYGIYEIVINNGNSSLYYNGDLVANSGFSGLGNFTNIVLGARFEGSNTFDTFYKGEIYEVLLLNSPASNGDRYKIEKYLLDKWGTTQISRTIPISNIYAWLDASSKENFTLDANNNVLAWKDKNFKLNFVQSNPSYYPVFENNRVIFDGSYLTMTDTVGLNLNNFTIFYVFDEISHNNNAGLLSCINTLGQTDNQNTSCFALTTPSSNTIRLAINSINLSYTDSTSLSKKLYEFNVNNGVGRLYVNGVVIQNATFGSLGTGLKFAIGARQNSSTIDTSVELNANLYEILILNTSASYGQRNQIYSYLNEKWNINCFLSTPAPNPTIWLDSNNSSSITVDGSNNITAWSDLSSNNYTVEIDNAQPVLTTINNLKYAAFDGSNVNITFPSNLTGSNSSLYIVFSASSLMTTPDCRLVNASIGDSASESSGLNINNGLNNGTLLYDNASIKITIKSNTVYILSILNNNGTSSIYLNNYLINSYSGITYNYGILNLGSYYVGSNFWKGLISEFIFYTNTLDSNSNLGTINYLANKWSINTSSSPINEYIQRTKSTVTNTLLLNNIFTSPTNYVTVSNSTNKSSDININILAPVTLTQSNQLNIMTTDIIYLTSIDINTIYSVNPVVQNGIINLPVLSNDNDYFAFKNIGVYPFIVTGLNNLYVLVPIGTTKYFTNSGSTYTPSNEFQGYACTLNQYDNENSEIFTVYIGGWSSKLNYITQLYIYDDDNNLLTTTNNIYFNESYQADFSFEISPGTYNLIISDIKSNTGNIISAVIDTPVVITEPTAVLNHYINGSSTYVITLGYWNPVFSGITDLDVWVSLNSDYSDSTYLLTTNTIQTNTASFTHVFENGFYWLTLKQTAPNVTININITNPIVINPNFIFSLDNTDHLTSNYNIILDLWQDEYTTNIPILYIHGYINSDYSDSPIILSAVNTTNIVNTNGVYTLPFTYTFDIGRDYYLSVSDTFTLDGIFDINLTNHINKLSITGTINQAYGVINYNNVYTITLSNNENYDLSTYNSQWTIYSANNNLSNNATVVTTTTINSSQQITFSYNPGFNNSTIYFYVGNTTLFTSPIRWNPTNISGCQLWLDSSLNSNFTFSSDNNISTWLDSSGNDNTVTAYNSPQLTANQVSFNGTDQYFTTNYTSGPTSETIFIIINCNDVNVENDFLSGNGTGQRDFLLYNNDIQVVKINDGPYVTSNLSPIANNTYMLSYNLSPTNINIYTDGTLTGSNTGNFSFSSGDTFIGSYGGITNFLDGYISEIIIYNSVLSQYQRQITEGYLAWKWGLNTNLPPSHPFYNTPPAPNQSSIPPTWSPINLPGLSLWLDGNDPSGTNTVPGQGSTVSIWNDKSGNANNTTGAIGDSITWNNGLVFNGTNYFTLPNGALPFNDSSYSIYVVATFPTNITTGTIILNAGALNSNQVLSIAGNSGNVIWTYWWNNDINTSSSFTVNTPFLYDSLYQSGGNRTVFLSGSASGSDTPGTRAQPNTGNYIGGDERNEYNMSGTISEVIVYSTNHNDLQRQVVEGYLAWKWGIKSTLPANHPFYNNPPSSNQPTSWSPLNINNIGVWFDGADVLGTGLETPNNTVINTWVDKAGTNNNAIVLSGSPTLNQNTLNGLPTIVFDGNSVMNSPISLKTIQDFTVFIIAKSNIFNDTTSAVLSINSYPGTRPTMLNIYQSSTNKWWFSGGDDGYDGNVNTVTLSGSRFDINANYWEPEQTQVNINGTSFSSSADAPATLKNLSTLLIGGTTSSGTTINEEWSGNIAEIILYETTLTTTERQVVEGYLAWKWRLQSNLPNTHPFHNVPPTPNQPIVPYWLPTNISGLRLWLDGMDPANTGVFPANNSTLTSWIDKSTNNNDATVFGTAISSNNTVVFDGSTTYLTTPYTSVPTTETAFVVINFNNITSKQGIISTSTEDGREFNIYQENLYINSDSGTDSIPINTTRLIEYSVNSTNINIYESGRLDTNITGSFSFTGGGSTKIGNNYVPNAPLNGSISEIIIYNSVLTLQKRQVVEGYLSWKWNIQTNLPANHPFYSRAPTVNQPLSLYRQESNIVNLIKPMEENIIKKEPLVPKIDLKPKSMKLYRI